MDKFVTRKEVLKILKIHYHTLYNMVKRGEIETLQIGKRNLYNLDKFLRDKGVTNKKKNKRFVIVEFQVINKKKI